MGSAGLWVQIHKMLRIRACHQSGRKPVPTAVILDSESVKMDNQAGTLIIDAVKKINGRKRHVLTAPPGIDPTRIGNSSPRAGSGRGQNPVGAGAQRLQCLHKIWAGNNKGNHFVGYWIKAQRRYGELHRKNLSKPLRQKDFSVLTKRWIGESKFGWMVKSRRLARDYEVRTDHIEAFIYIVMIRATIWHWAAAAV